jgi:hypothetical protein
MKTVSAAGAAVVELGQWVASKNDTAKTALLDEHVASGLTLQSAEFNEMVNQFLAETNQSIVSE